MASSTTGNRPQEPSWHMKSVNKVLSMMYQQKKTCICLHYLKLEFDFFSICSHIKSELGQTYFSTCSMTLFSFAPKTPSLYLEACLSCCGLTLSSANHNVGYKGWWRGGDCSFSTNQVLVGRPFVCSIFISSKNSSNFQTWHVKPVGEETSTSVHNHTVNHLIICYITPLHFFHYKQKQHIYLDSAMSHFNKFIV